MRGAVEHFYELTSDGQQVARVIEQVIALAPRRAPREGKRRAKAR